MIRTKGGNADVIDKSLIRINTDTYESGLSSDQPKEEDWYSTCDADSSPYKDDVAEISVLAMPSSKTDGSVHLPDARVHAP